MALEKNYPAGILVPFLALYDRRAYRMAVERWRGLAVLYSLAVTTLSWAVLMPAHLPRVGDRFSEFVDNLEVSFPEFTVADGKFHSEVAQPFAITDPQGKVILVIDEDIQGDAIPEWDGESVFFIGRDGVFYGDARRMSRFDMSDIPDMDKAATVQALRGIPDQLWSIGTALFPLLVAGSLFFRLVLTFFWALLAVSVGKAGGRDFTFFGAFRVAAVASTPALFLTTAGDLIGTAAWISWAGLGLTTFYVVFGMLSLERRRP